MKRLFILITTVVWVAAAIHAVEYALWINGIQVTSANEDYLSGIRGVTGTVTYDRYTKTLTLNNATLTIAGYHNIKSTSEVTINVVGTNTLNVTSGPYSCVYNEFANMTITGTGTLNCHSAEGTGCTVGSAMTMYIQGGVQAKFTGAIGFKGLTQYSCLVVNENATKVTANGSEKSIQRLRTFFHDGLAITQPAGAYFNSEYDVVDANGNVVSGQDVVISAAPARGFKRGGLWYEPTTGNYVTLIPPQNGEIYTGNVIIPAAFQYNGAVLEVNAIEASAFTDATVTSIEVPATVTSIGEKAFYGARNLKTLVLLSEKRPNQFTLLGENFVGSNASGFACYVPNNQLLLWLQTYSAINFLPWVTTRDNGFLTFSCCRNITLPAGLTAYKVSGFDTGRRMATTTQLTNSHIPRKNGVILQGEPSTRYLLPVATSVPTIINNMLCPLLNVDDIPYAPLAANPDDTKAYFLGNSCVEWREFQNNIDLFMSLNTGIAYLAVDKTLLGGDYTSPVQLDLWSVIPGDLTGEGIVDVEDVNAVINIILKVKTAADYPGNADVTGEGIIDVEDVNAIINIILKIN